VSQSASVPTTKRVCTWQHFTLKHCHMKKTGDHSIKRETFISVYISRESQTTRKVYWLCASACVCLSLAALPHHCTDPDVSWWNDMGCPLIVPYSADLQSAHGFCCYDKIALNVWWSRPCVSVCLSLPHAYRLVTNPVT